jgi:hypothetical protein
MLSEFESRSIFSEPQLQSTQLLYRKQKVVDLIPAKTQAKEFLSCFVNIVHCFNVLKWFVFLWKSHGKQQKIMHSKTLEHIITLSEGLWLRSAVINPRVHQPCVLAAYRLKTWTCSTMVIRHGFGWRNIWLLKVKYCPVRRLQWSGKISGPSLNTQAKQGK